MELIGLAAITGGTLLMIQKKEDTGAAKGRSWLIYAVLSAVFASLTSIFGKIGITGVESNLGTALRTIVVLCMAWLVVFVKGKRKLVRQIPRRELPFPALPRGLPGSATTKLCKMAPPVWWCPLTS